MTDEERGYWRGAMAAWAHVLNYLNTLETREVSKSQLYAASMAMRPRDLQAAD